MGVSFDPPRANAAWAEDEGFPFELFNLLMRPENAEKIEKSPECLWDDFAVFFIQRWKDKGGVGCVGALHVLACLAEGIRLDASPIECAHSFWQREA